MSFHFLTFIKKLLVNNCTLDSSDFSNAAHEVPGYIFVESRSLSFATDLSNRVCSSNLELVGFWSGSLRCISSTQRCKPRHITTQDVRSFVVVE